LNKFDQKSIYDFNVKNTYPYYSHIVMNDEEKINTWAIFWYATVYFKNGLSLHPLNSMVINTGHDGSGTHCEESCSFEVKLEMDDREGFFPKNLIVDQSINSRLANYYKSLKKPFVIRVVNKLKRILKGNK